MNIFKGEASSGYDEGKGHAYLRVRLHPQQHEIIVDPAQAYTIGGPVPPKEKLELEIIKQLSKVAEHAAMMILGSGLSALARRELTPEEIAPTYSFALTKRDIEIEHLRKENVRLGEIISKRDVQIETLERVLRPRGK